MNRAFFVNSSCTKHRLIIILLLSLNSIITTAQDWHYYADPLQLNGKIKSVNFYTISPEKPTDTFAIADIAYDKVTHTRRMFAYASPFRKSMTSREVQDMQDTAVYVTYNDVENKFRRYNVSKDERGNRKLTPYGRQAGSVASVCTKDVQQRLASIVHFAEGSMEAMEVFRYTNDGKVIREFVDGGGTLKSRAVFTYDAHHNPITIEGEDWDVNPDTAITKGYSSEKFVHRFVYTYDDKGNYTTYTSYYNGKQQHTHHRDIVYE